MSRRRCCCHPACVIFEDDFNRADSTDLGGDWTEVVGDSDIFSNTLRIPPGGLVLCNTRHPVPDVTGLAGADIIGLAVGTLHRVCINYLDENYYLFSQFYKTAGGEHYVQVGTRIGGTETILETLQVTQSSGKLWACFDGATLVGYISNTEPAWACASPIAGGYFAALANAGSVVLQFDNFEFLEHWLTHPECPPCICNCEGYCIKGDKLATFAATGTCSPLDGLTFTLAQNTTPYTGACGGLYWSGSGWFLGDWWSLCLGCPSCDTSVTCMQWPLSGEAVPCITEPIGWDTSELTPCPTAYGEQALPSSCTCDPFVLVYGPFNVDHSPCECFGCMDGEGNCSGSYTITITQAP